MPSAVLRRDERLTSRSGPRGAGDGGGGRGGPGGRFLPFPPSLRETRHFSLNEFKQRKNLGEEMAGACRGQRSSALGGPADVPVVELVPLGNVWR